MVRCYEGENDFLDLTPGKYVVRIEEVDMGESSSGNEVMYLRGPILSEGQFKGGKFSHKFPLWMIRTLGKALGKPRLVDPENGKGYYEVEPMDLFGVTIEVEIAHREYQGKVYTGPKMVRLKDKPAPGAATPAPAGDDSVPF